jgi:hypothetical protein
MTVMKSRRRIAAPRLGSTPIPADYIRDLRPAEWGLIVILRRDRMSVLGQKQTFNDV